jgi:catechol 2,3-dioxygenase-like lactoylglutathione lyase family enzyme
MASVVRLQHTSIPMPSGGQAKARDFFGNVLGMSEVPPPSTLDVANLVWFLAGDRGHEVHLFVDNELAAKSAAQHLCLQVDDLDAYRNRFTAAGVAVEETTPIVGRPRFFVHDPFGNFLEIMQLNGDYR